MNKKNFNNIYISSRFILFAIFAHSYADINRADSLGIMEPSYMSSNIIATDNSKKNKLSLIWFQNHKNFNDPFITSIFFRKKTLSTNSFVKIKKMNWFQFFRQNKREHHDLIYFDIRLKGPRSTLYDRECHLISFNYRNEIKTTYSSFINVLT